MIYFKNEKICKKIKKVTYTGKDALCLGISSATTFDWEMIAADVFEDIAPKNIVMHLGTNNIYDDGKTVTETVADLQRLFTMLHGYYPETSIYYFGISLRKLCIFPLFSELEHFF